jgi:hypothetical protein
MALGAVSRLRAFRSRLLEYFAGAIRRAATRDAQQKNGLDRQDLGRCISQSDGVV